MGGYRESYYFAQDVDLWMRLTDEAFLAFMPAVLYQAQIGASSISMTHAKAQMELLGVICRAVKARQSGQDEAPLLREAERICAASRAAAKRRRREDGGNYFIGRMLQSQGDRRAAKYLRRAAWQNPMNLRVLWALGLEVLRARR